LEACGSGEAPGHGWGVVGEAETAVGGEKDDAAVAAETAVEVGDGLAGGDIWGCAVCDAVGGPLAEDQLHDGFAPAGERDGGGEIVGIAAATDQRGVADTAGSFVEGSTGGGGGGEVAAGVEGNGADGIVRPQRRRPVAGGPVVLRGVLAGRAEAFGVSHRVCGLTVGFVAWECSFRTFVIVEDGVQDSFGAGEGLVREAGGFAKLGVGEAFALAVEDEFGVVDEGHAVGVGEVLCTRADEVDVRTFFEDQAGGLNGVAKALDAGYAASLHASAVHEEGVELDAAIRGEKAATSGIEGGIVFEDGDGGFDGVEGGCAAREKCVAVFKGAADAGFVSGSGVGGDGPCATVNDECGRVGGRGHRVIVEHFSQWRFVDSHPSHKNKDVARVGHPVYLLGRLPFWEGKVVFLLLLYLNWKSCQRVEGGEKWLSD